jgi:hypothetical protein
LLEEYKLEDYFKEFYKVSEEIDLEKSMPNPDWPYIKTLAQKKAKYSELAFGYIHSCRKQKKKYTMFNNASSFPDRYKKIKLIIQYYDEANPQRRQELIKSITNNINNPYLDKIFLYVEFSKSTRKPAEMVADFGQINTKKIQIIPTKKRMTYLEAIECAKHDNDSHSVYLLANNDCFFDISVSLLRKVNFQNNNLIICLTRKDMLKDGRVVDAVEPNVSSAGYVLEKEFELNRENCNLLDISSQDAWAFTKDIQVNFDANIEIGIFNCEYNFTTNAYRAGKILRSAGEYIKCIHLHNTMFRKEYAFTNKKTTTTNNRMYPSEEFPRTKENYINGTWRIRSEYNYIDNQSPFQSYSDFFVSDFNDLVK